MRLLPLRLLPLRLLVLVLFSASACSHASTCPDLADARRNGEPARIRYVSDGDSLVLEDGRRVRLIGINAPEARRDSQPAEPWSNEARQSVRTRLSDNSTVWLINGNETRDQHGRWLFHVFDDHGNLGLSLLLEGLAAQVTVAPNTVCADRYRSADRQARSDGAGLWSDPGFWLKSTRQLNPSDKGFRIVQGEVEKVLLDSGKPRLLLSGGPLIMLPRKQSAADRRWFRSLETQTVEARGWWSRHRRQHFLTLSHRSNLDLLP